MNSSSCSRLPPIALSRELPFIPCASHSSYRGHVNGNEQADDLGSPGLSAPSSVKKHREGGSRDPGRPITSTDWRPRKMCPARGGASFRHRQERAGRSAPGARLTHGKRTPSRECAEHSPGRRGRGPHGALHPASSSLPLFLVLPFNPPSMIWRRQDTGGLAPHGGTPLLS